MNAIARFIVRKDGLIIGGSFKGYKLKDDVVYKIVNFDGNDCIDEVGVMLDELRDDFNVMNIGYFLDKYGKYAFLTKEEL